MPRAIGVVGTPIVAYDAVRNIVYINNEEVQKLSEEGQSAIIRRAENMPLVA